MEWQEKLLSWHPERPDSFSLGLARGAEPRIDLYVVRALLVDETRIMVKIRRSSTIEARSATQVP